MCRNAAGMKTRCIFLDIRSAFYVKFLTAFKLIDTRCVFFIYLQIKLKSMSFKTEILTLTVTVTMRILETRKPNDVRLPMSTPPPLTASDRAPNDMKNRSSEVTIASPILCAKTRLLKN